MWLGPQLLPSRFLWLQPTLAPGGGLCTWKLLQAQASGVWSPRPVTLSSWPAQCTFCDKQTVSLQTPGNG